MSQVDAYLGADGLSLNMPLKHLRSSVELDVPCRLMRAIADLMEFNTVSCPFLKFLCYAGDDSFIVG